MLTLDASKAFDRVEYCKLFELLIDRGICPIYARLLMYTCMHTHQKLRVNWNGAYSSLFEVSNGVKQGLSFHPFFSVFILMC